MIVSKLKLYLNLSFYKYIEHRIYLQLVTSFIWIKHNWEKKTYKNYLCADAFIVQKGHIKCTIAQKGVYWPPFLVLIFA